VQACGDVSQWSRYRETQAYRPIPDVTMRLIGPLRLIQSKVQQPTILYTILVYLYNLMN